MAPFDVTGPLPTGTTLLEASAGTGKTWTVGALVTRYVAEGRARLDEMLVITFGRAASQELRERVREQLVAAERALGDPAHVAPDDALLTLLVHGTASAPVDDAERAERRHRLRDALAGFDGATIATTHQFCQLVLRSLGVAGDTDTGATLVESLDDLVVEVVDDLYLARFGHLPDAPPFDRATALELARAAVGDPQARLVPDGGPGSEPAPDPGTPGGARLVFAAAVRAEVDRRKRRLGVLGYDDLLSRLAGALEADDAPARERMRARWRIVLVDEFQDTDPVQWQVLDRAFSGAATMVLIGDPKQAIYAFRGGDVVAYLAAASTATHRATLATNWRSDDGLVRRLQTVLRGAALGHPEIVVRDVAAHHGADGAPPRLAGAPHSSPFRLRQVLRQASGCCAPATSVPPTPASTSPATARATSPRCWPPTPPGRAAPCAPPTWPCSWPPATTGCSCSARWPSAGWPPWSPVAATSSPRPPPTTGWRCWRASSSRTARAGCGPPRSPASSATTWPTSTPTATPGPTPGPTPSPTPSPTPCAGGRCCCAAEGWRPSWRPPRSAA